MSQGMMTMGFTPSVAVDFNDKFLKLYDIQGDATLIHGDVNELSTLLRIWDSSKSGTLAAGFACQPYSILGD